MRKSAAGGAWVLLACLVALSGSRAFALADVVHLANGQEQKGAIKKDAIDGVEIAVGAGALTFKAEEVDSIDWDIQTVEFQNGLADMRQGDYAAAAASFQALYGDADSMKVFREVAKPYLAYLVGECFYRAGKHQDAVAAFEAFMNDYKTSRYVPLAVGSLVDSAIQAKKFDKVPPLLSKLEALGGENKAKALIFGAELDLVQGNASGAEAKFNSAAGASSVKETQGLARLGLARIAVTKKDFSKARTAAEQAIASSSSKAVAGTAYLIIGDALFNEASALKGDEAKEKFLDASMAFLRIPVNYADKRIEPEALFKAGECFYQLSKFPGRSNDRDRAATMYNTVLDKYKATRWGTEAQASLKKIR
ncbi:MAG: tetratricopeptide repeat protein [Planctomycetota bacterium]|nr:tetratricopeptide repeat protein [Planctomycetota bacterium]